MIDLKKMRDTMEFLAFNDAHRADLEPCQVLELLDMLEAANLDAARYQWLAVQHWVEPEATFRLGLKDVEFTNAYMAELGAAIDAAMAATKGEQ